MTAETTTNPAVTRGPHDPPLPRRVPFDFAATCPPYWMGGSYSASCLLDAYTLMFPAMEAFMVKHMADLARRTDAPLDRAAVQGFLKQEGAHAREHRRSMDCVRAQGYDIDRIESSIGTLFAVLDRVVALLHRTPYGDQLMTGIMAGGEHWTAAMSEMSFTPGLLASTVGQVDRTEPPREITDMELLYLWHCAEELEHKAVAADVFAAVGGREVTRLISFGMATTIFFVLTGMTFLPMLRQSRTVLGPELWPYIGERGGWRGLGNDIRWSLSPMVGVYGRAIRQYLRRGFHPNDVDTDYLAQRAFRRLEELRTISPA
jgi:predicted metal-dependent hydrolase